MNSMKPAAWTKRDKPLNRAVTLEDVALCIIAQSCPGRLYRYGFNDALKAIMVYGDGTSAYTAEWAEVMQGHRVSPDAYAVYVAGKELVVYEVEDTNPLMLQKLFDYRELWLVLENLQWNLRLIVTDRYGVSCTEIPLECVDVCLGALVDGAAYRTEYDKWPGFILRPPRGASLDWFAEDDSIRRGGERQ